MYHYNGKKIRSLHAASIFSSQLGRLPIPTHQTALSFRMTLTSWVQACSETCKHNLLIRALLMLCHRAE